jgi:hypothetical protein
VDLDQELALHLKVYGDASCFGSSGPGDVVISLIQVKPSKINAVTACRPTHKAILSNAYIKRVWPKWDRANFLGSDIKSYCWIFQEFLIPGFVYRHR